MTTTDKFQVLSDFYYTEKECKDAKYNKDIRKNTNPRYHNFNQIYFTAGDVDQFNEFRDATNGTNPDPKIDLEGNIWNDMFLKLKDLNLHEKIKDVVENLDWPKYRNLSVDSVDNTFFYIFDKFKKGIFVKIKDNKLCVFLPFSKHNYTNEWSDRMKHDPSLFSDITHFLQYASKINGYNVPLDKINKFTEKWYGNNCLIRTEYPIMENDRGMTNVKDMLVSLCNSRKVPDIEFFINKRDYPLITKREFEPYEQIYDTENQQLLSNNYNTYSPILSMVTTDKHSDIPFPTHEDWARVSTQEDNKFFYPDCRDYKYNFEMDWGKKIPTAVFRGASTGCGVTVETNPRLKASYLSTVSPVENGYKLLDAGITKWNLRPRKIMGNKYLQLIEPNKLSFGLVSGLTPEEQSKYKYILNIDGHVTAFRLSLELSIGSVVLLTESKYRIWYMRYLKAGVHYIPVKNDLSDLFEKIRWCRDNDKECEKIAKNAKMFYDDYLSKNGILDYLQYLFIKIKKTTGTYFYNSLKIEDLILKKQIEIIKDYGFGNENKLDIPSEENKKLIEYNQNYRYYINEGVRLFLSDKDDKDDKDDKEKKYDTLHESKDTKILKYNNFVIKKINDDENRKKQLVNEVFCGLTLINDLIKEIPNFRYTYFINKEQNSTVSEYVEGVTLQQYINDGCSFSELIKVLLMVNLSLCVAQERFGFVHYDLYPWNIIIKKVEKRSISYRLKHNIFKVETDIIPVIIDYGRSHVIQDNVHYGTIEQFKTKLFQDSLSLVVCCFYSFLNVKDVKNSKGKRYINDYVRDNIINIINFYSGTEFLKNEVKDYSQLCSFLDKNKKYNEMIFGNKCGLEEKDSTTFFYYLYNIYLEKINKEVNVFSLTRYMYPQKPSYDTVHLNSMFFYKIVIGESPYYEIFKYLENIEMKYESLLSESKNILMKINVCNMIDISVRDILKFVNYISSIDIKYKNELKYPTAEKLRYICDRILKRLEQKYVFTYINYEGDIEYKKDDFIFPLKYFYVRPNPIVARYTTKTFSMPDEILTILQGNNLSRKNNKIYDFILEMRDIIIINFLYDMKYKILNEQDEHSFMKNNKKYLLFNPVVIYNERANINTIKMISNVLYKKEIKVLENIVNKPEKILMAFRNILNITKY
jgi:hypothetical protein